MSEPTRASEPVAADTEDTGHAKAAPGADFRDALAWLALGMAVVIGSWRMDRLTQQNINPVTVPGLLPGLLGLGMILLGAVLGLRSLQRGARHRAAAAPNELDRQQRKRVGLAIGLCVGYAVVLVGHGLPFWLVSTVYVTTSILVFRRISPDPIERHFSTRSVLQALVIGAAVSVITWLVFERLFLVRLP